MTRILWATDIHLSAAEQQVVDEFCSAVNAAGAEALLLGGDIADGPELEGWFEFLRSRVEIPMYFVLGNHDYYGFDIITTRERMRGIEQPRWLPAAGVVPLDEGVALVGEGGWGDARLGDFENSSVVLNDYLAIKELSQAFDLDAFDGDLSHQHALKKILMDLGDSAADSLRPGLIQAASNNRHVLVLTHVPPFREACWYKTGLSDDNWLPGFSCKAIGDLLLTVAEAYPACRITVFCGHTHGHGVTDIRTNLRVHTGEARYGTAAFKVVEVENDQVTVV